MKCRDVRRKLVEYAEASLPLGEKAEVESHLEICARCRAERAALDRAETALRALAAVETAPELTADLHHRLAAGRPVRRFTWAWAGVGVAAVAVTLRLALWTQPKTPASQPQAPPTRIATQLPSVSPVPPRVSVVPAMQQPEPTSKPRLPRHHPHHARDAAPVRSTPPESAVAEAMAPEPVEATPETDPNAPIGVILLIGTPRETAPVSSYHVEISFPDGAKSMKEQVVERDAHDRPRAVRIAYDHTAPDAQPPAQGG